VGEVFAFVNCTLFNIETIHVQVLNKKKCIEQY